MQTVLGNLETATAQLSVINFSSMIGDVEALVTTAQESLKLTMNKLDTIDFAALNQAIEGTFLPLLWHQYPWDLLCVYPYNG